MLFPDSRKNNKNLLNLFEIYFMAAYADQWYMHKLMYMHTD